MTVAVISLWGQRAGLAGKVGSFVGLDDGMGEGGGDGTGVVGGQIGAELCTSDVFKVGGADGLACGFEFGTGVFEGDVVVTVG